MFDFALMIFLLLSPIILLPQIGNITALQYYQFGMIDSSNQYLQLQFFQFSVIALYLISLFQKKTRELDDKWLVLFILGCLITTLLHPISVKLFGNIFLGFLLYKLVYEYVKRIRLLLFSIVIISILNFIFQVLQFFGINFIYPYAGLMKNPSHLGVYQALAIPICFYFNPYLAIIPIIGLLLTKTWTALFAVVFTICFVFRKKIKDLGSTWLMFFMSCAALFIILFHKLILYDLAPRLWIWKETIKNLDFTGHGFGNMKFTREIGDTFTNPYNEYLTILYALGIFSIPIFIWLNRTLKIRNRLFPSCLILLVIGFGQSFMDFPRLAGTAIVLFSLLNVKLKGGENGAC